MRMRAEKGVRRAAGRAALPALLLVCLASASGAQAQVQIQPGAAGSRIRIESSGNISLDGHCFGNVSSLPTGQVARLYNGQAVAKDGNLYFTGELYLNSGIFPVGHVMARSGSTPLAAITNTGQLYLKGQCVNSSGCSNTTWEPVKWNDGGTVQRGNNCYNYGNDKLTGTFAQPGRASGQMYSAITVTEVREAALRDGLRWVGWTFPGNTYDCGDGHLVFMAIWPGWDYHWWRLDQTKGVWSHKPGRTAAVNVDSSNNVITNPLVANRGSYTDPGGFYCTCGGLANIN